MSPATHFGTVLGCVVLCASTGCIAGNTQVASSAPPRASDSGTSDASAASPSDAATLDGGSADFELRLLGDSIVLNQVGRPAYALQMAGCPAHAGLPSVTKPDNTPLRDDRQAPAARAGYYWDGSFVAAQPPPATPVPYTSWGVCDTPGAYTCQAASFTQVLAVAREYVTTGTRASLEVADGGASVLVPTIETRPFHGKLQVRLGYNVDPDCKSEGAVSTTLELEVPEQGVCCPIGPAGCGSPGPAGGWAGSLQACPTWRTSAEPLWSGPDLRVQRELDLHGCPILRNLGTACDGDAGAGG